MNIRTLGIIGLGQFGTFVEERVREAAPQVTIRGWDENGRKSADLDRTLQSDAVVFAVPPEKYVQTMQRFVPQMRKDGIIIDVCTVKMVTVAAIGEISNGRPYLATHPMFGRQSWLDMGRSLKDLQLVICKRTLTDETYFALRYFFAKQLRLKVVRMTPEEHDEFQAHEQLLPQHIGCAIKRTGFKLNDRNIHTVSAGHFYRAMKIVENDEALFRQASKLNPFWPGVLAKYELAQAEHKLQMLNGD